MKTRNRIIRFVLVTILFAVIYFLAYHFAITDTDRTANHRIGIEKLNPLEQKLVGKWWTSYSGFERRNGIRYKFSKFRYTLFSADKRHWQKSESNERPNNANWTINAKDSVLTVDFDKKQTKTVTYKITYIDSSSVYLKEFREDKRDNHIEWKRY